MLMKTQSYLTAVLAVAILILPTTMPCQDSDETASKSTEPAMSDAAKSEFTARQKLKREISCEYNETEFKDIMTEFESQLGVEIILDQSARDDMLASDTPVTFRISEFPASTLLRAMLVEHNATYIVQDGLIKIISRDVESDPEFFSRRIFDVGGVLDEISRREQADTAGGLLTDTIKMSIGPDNWDDTNGDATVDILGGLMIVNAPEKTGDEIEGLLQNMRFCWAQ